MLQSRFPECFQKPAAKPVARTSAFNNVPAGSLQANFCRSPVALRNAAFASTSHHLMLSTPASVLHRWLCCFARSDGETDKEGHKKEQLFIPERCLHLDSLPAPFPLPTSPCAPHRCLTLMPAYFLQSLAAAAGPLRQPRFPWLSLLLQAEGWLAALLQERYGPPAPTLTTKALQKEKIFSPFLSLSFHPSPSLFPTSTTPNLAAPRTPHR